MRSIASDPVRSEYARLSHHYDHRWSFYVSCSVEETLRRVSIRPRSRVLDIGCGTGTLLQALRLRYPQAALTGIDACAEMLKLAAMKLGRGARLCVASAQRLPVTDEAFDVVISTSVLHYFRDPACALAEMSRVVRPRGHVAITDWCGDFWTCRLLDRWLRCFNAAHYQTYTMAQCAEMMQAAGLRPMLLQRYKISPLWGLMTVVAAKPPF